ncbi:MAG: ABC transporter ATP-binding protein [Candidatus Hodarchaeota archaeon]
MLEVRNLTKAFGGLVAVNDVTLTIDEGEIVGLIGPNGAGKTTTFNLIHGQLRPDSGSIKFKGQDVTGSKPHAKTKQGMARTFQILKLFESMTVEQNVYAGRIVRTGSFSWNSLRPRTGSTASQIIQDSKINEILDLVGLEKMRTVKAGAIPHAYRKRLEIARALATEPNLMLLDEPSAGLNPSEVDELMNLIRTIHNMGITLLLVEHVMRFIMNVSERMVVLNLGSVIAEGTPKEISRDEKVINAYLGERYALR